MKVFRVDINLLWCKLLAILPYRKAMVRTTLNQPGRSKAEFHVRFVSLEVHRNRLGLEKKESFKNRQLPKMKINVPTVEAFLSTSAHLRVNDLTTLAAVDPLTIVIGNAVNVHLQLDIRSRNLFSLS